MAQGNHNDDHSKRNEWLFISTAVSVAGGAIMAAARGIGWGIATFLLTMGLCWLSYIRKKK